jgi:hypothetical protein
MRFPWVRGILGKLLSCIHDVGSGSLSEIIEFANDRMVVEVAIERWCILEGMELQRDLRRDRLHFGIRQVHISNNSIDKRFLGKLIGSISQFLDVNSDLVGRMALVFNVEPSVLDFANCCFELVIILA